jgi:5'-deoxynucleotidase YfbR-like HD superfamily hydrolase
MAIVFTIWPMPSVELLKAVIDHDAPESITGDMPAPVKWRHKRLAKELEATELAICHEFKLTTEFDIDDFEKKILHYCDIMEFALFASEEIDMGNRVMLTQYQNAMEAFKRLDLIDITPEAKELYDYIKARGEILYPQVAAEHLPLHSWPGY